MPVKLGELLLKESMATPQQVQEALALQRAKGGKLSKAFVTLGYLKDEEITSLLARRYGVPALDLDAFEVDSALLRIVPAETARKYQLLPVSRHEATLTLALADPTNVFAMDDIKFMTGYNVEQVVVSETALERAIDRCYGTPPSLALRGPDRPGGGGGSTREVLDAPGLTADDLASFELSEDDVDALSELEAGRATSGREEIDLDRLGKPYPLNLAAELASLLVVEAVKRGASDVHIEPYESELRVRFRLDGHLENVMALPLGLRDPLLSGIKSLARLDVREVRRPQHGHLSTRLRRGTRSRDLELRVSCLPTRGGEKIVLRVLDPSTLVTDLTRLGFPPHSLAPLERALGGHGGLVLVAGPLGSGKTTTLHSLLAGLRERGLDIVTVESPLAFGLPGIHQVVLRPDVGLDFGTALAVSMRQASDVVALDPLADDLTAEAVVRLGARSGRLLIATLLEQDATSALATLVERTGQASDAARAVRLVVAQRLVRRICPGCKTEVAEPPSERLLEVGVAPDPMSSFRLYEGKGCGACNGTGYKGRVGLFEVLEVSDGIRDLVRRGAGSREIERRALEEGLLTLRRSGIENIKAGLTTIEEVVRHTAPGPRSEPPEASGPSTRRAGRAAAVRDSPDRTVHEEGRTAS